MAACTSRKAGAMLLLRRNVVNEGHLLPFVFAAFQQRAQLLEGAEVALFGAVHQAEQQEHAEGFLFLGQLVGGKGCVLGGL